MTDIYPYRINTPQGQEFIVTGPPISFAFPKAAYANYENGKGGPQASVDLRLDRVTLNPFANLLAERGIQNFERTSKNVKDVEHRKLNVQIFSNYLRPSVKTQFSYWLQDVDNSTKIRICDFEFFRVFGNSSYYENLSDANIGGINVEPATYKGISSGVGSSARIAECTIGSPICRLSFDYRSREVRFDIPRSDFCLNQDLTSKLRRLLAYHEIKGSQ